MDEARMLALVKQYGTERILVNSAADWGVSDPLKVPKTAALMRANGIPEADLEKLFWNQPGQLLRPERPLRRGGVRSPGFKRFDRSARAVRGQLGAARPGPADRKGIDLQPLCFYNGCHYQTIGRALAKRGIPVKTSSCPGLSW